MNISVVDRDCPVVSLLVLCYASVYDEVQYLVSSSGSLHMMYDYLRYF